MRVADYIIQRLVCEGIKHLFMIAGRGILYLSDAVAKCTDMECIPVHHEQAAAFAAMAYSQYNNNLGGCLVSTGCASTNAITATLCAWQDNIPCVFISGQNTLRETVRHTKLNIRTYGQQEADIVDIVSSITKYAIMIEDPSRIVYEMDKAIYLSQNGRKGPVWIDIPLDIQNMRIEPDDHERYIPENDTIPVNEEDVKIIYSWLKNASRPVIFIGSGIRSAGATNILSEFVEKNKLPVVYASSAVDIYGADHDLSMGTVSTLAGNRAANFAVQNADVVVVIGCRLSSMTVGNAPQKFARNAKIAVVDIDSTEHKKATVRIDRFLHIDARDFLVKISKFPNFETDNNWQKKCRHWKEIFPKCESVCKTEGKIDLYYFAEQLSEVLDDDVVVVCDAGLEELIIPTTIEFRSHQRCLHPAAQGSMGYALPAGIGAWLASKKQIVVVVGDGSIMMNLQELQTISHYRYPLKIFVINNNCYAVIRKRQQDLFRTRTIGTDRENGVSCPDFSKVANCFDIPYRKISNTNELEVSLSDILDIPGPVLCEIMGLENQVYLHSSFARDKNGRFVQRPLEDQSPYLDRDVFLSEMLVEPIDQ